MIRRPGREAGRLLAARARAFFRPESRLRGLWALVCFVVLTLTLLPGLDGGRLSLRVGQVAPRDIEAPRDFLDRPTTERLRREAAAAVQPVYTQDRQVAADVDAALAAAAVSVLAVHGGLEELETFRRAAREARTPQEELRYLMALPELRDPEAFPRVLGIALTDEVRPQNLPQFLARALANRDRGPEAWAFVRERWQEIMARVAPSAAIYVVHGLRALTDPEAVRDVQAFFAEHDIPQAALQLRQVLESERVHAAFAARAPEELLALFGP